MTKRIILSVVVCILVLTPAIQAETVNGKLRPYKDVLWSFTSFDSDQYELTLMWGRKTVDLDFVMMVYDGSEAVPLAAGFARTKCFERAVIGLWATRETIYVLLRNNSGSSANYWMNFQTTQSSGLQKERLSYHGEFNEIVTQSTDEALIMQKASMLMDRLNKK